MPEMAVTKGAITRMPFADHLIEMALINRYGSPIPLDKIDDSLEDLAHKAGIERTKTAKALTNISK
jgi:CobQ-like glutamine amidotransferase family enzyme